MERIFLVGSPRSGTTLLQSLLASHSKITSFPETHLFSLTVPIHRVVRWFKFYTTGERQRLERQLRHLGLPSDKIEVPGHIRFRTRKWISMILANLDRLADEQANNGATHWLEKTPRHLHYAGLIGKADPSVKFIHIIRRGEHVVPSLYFATQQNPEDWDGRRSIKKCVYWWNRSIRLSSRYFDDPNHIHVSYEQLVESTERVMEALCRFLELEYEPEMLAHYHETAKSLIESSEHWKQKNTESQISGSSKLHRLNSEEQQYIKNNLLEFDYEQIQV